MIIGASFWFFPYSIVVNAASLTALFKHVGSVEEPSTDDVIRDVIREKVIHFLRDKVRNMFLIIIIVIMISLCCCIVNLEMNTKFYNIFIIGVPYQS